MVVNMFHFAKIIKQMLNVVIFWLEELLAVGQVAVTGLAAAIDSANPMSMEEVLAIGVAANAEQRLFWGNNAVSGDRSSNVELV